mgnify:CR=1 FL=1
MTTKSNGWTPKDMTNVAPCNVNTYRCTGDNCILHRDCRLNDRHECQECYNVLST